MLDREIRNLLNDLLDGNYLLVTIGNYLKKDDGAGPYIGSKLEDSFTSHLIRAGNAPENYAQKIVVKAPENLLLLDSVEFGGEKGEIRIFTPEQLKSGFSLTHGPGSSNLIKFLRMSGFEGDIYFIGIQPKEIKLEEGLTEAVENSCNELINFFLSSI